MSKQDTELLEVYMHGFNDELDGRTKMWVISMKIKTY